MSRTQLSSVVSTQIPEFVREDYPTFVAFVEAYYEYLQAQGVDLSSARDLDLTLDKFLLEFKKELAHNLPNIIADERFALARIKDQYLSKGSEASYKLLFKLLFGKNVELKYPSSQMLRASDGRWNQEISVFAQVDFGDPTTIVGKLVDIQTATRLIRVLVDRKENLIGEVDRIVALGGNVYEFFLDKKFYGVLKPTDRIKYKDEFQATILPATQTPRISQAGKNFRIGQVFEIKSGTGTGALLKVTAVDANNGIKYAEFIKFGIGYNANFAVSILASNTVNSAQTTTALASVSRTGNNLAIGDYTQGFDEQGYINMGDVFASTYIDGTYAGTIVREFSLNYRNAQTDSTQPAIIEVSLGALVRYPGYFTSNNGFLDDSIYIQDSKYYQAFSYVVKIDERLSSYKSAVKTMVHPAGMALFGEYNINNEVDLSISLESLVKALGIGLLDSTSVRDTNGLSINFGKSLSDIINTPTELWTHSFGKALSDSISTPSDAAALFTTKVFSDSISTPTESWVHSFGKALNDSISTPTDSSITFSIGTALSDTPIISEVLALNTTKYLTDNTAGFSESGTVGLNPYAAQDYMSETYNLITGSTIASTQ
jgi:hypothetical protein